MTPRCIGTRCSLRTALTLPVIMNSCYLAPATLADGPGAVGHYSQATNWSDQGSLQQIFDRVVQSGKWQCPVMIHGLS